MHPEVGYDLRIPAYHRVSVVLHVHKQHTRMLYGIRDVLQLKLAQIRICHQFHSKRTSDGWAFKEESKINLYLTEGRLNK
jgi:hypothetical protein